MQEITTISSLDMDAGIQNPIDVIDKLRHQQTALRVQLGSQENEILQLKHALDVALTKAGSWGGMKQRITLNKALSVYPEKVWQQGATHQTAFPAQEVVRSLERQVQEKSTELQEAQTQIQKMISVERELRQALEERARATAEAPHQPGPSSSTAASHLMSQVQFLHMEVERLENELATVREKSAEEVRRLNLNHATALKERMDGGTSTARENALLKSQMATLQRRVGKLNNGEDLFERCRLLETQLATAMSEKNAALVVKHDCAARMRKLEEQLKEEKSAHVHAERAATEGSNVAESHVKSLNELVTALSNDRDMLRSELSAQKSRLNRPTRSSEAQCEVKRVSESILQTDPTQPVMISASCQVNTIQHFADVDTLNAQSVAYALESKCAELDSTRSDLDRLVSVHQETLKFLEVTKNRLSDEATRRKTLEADGEKLSIQVRALQQQHSQLSALLRERDVALANAETRMQQALNAASKVEEERRALEHDVHLHAKDMQHLVGNQNLSNLQLHQLNSDNDALREEVQKLLQRETQCNYQIRSKDAELQEVLAAYQASVRESEKFAGGIKTLERENDNMRAALAAKEERLAQMQEQISQLHAREQQLSIDLQAGDYDRGLLNRKLVQTESSFAALQGQLYELQQQLNAAQRVNYEFERNTSELHKQLVIKDNETMLLRNRTDELEHEYSVLHTTSQVEHQRLKELEDANARLVVRGIVSQVAEREASKEEVQRSPIPSTPSPKASKEMEELRTGLTRATRSLHTANSSLEQMERKNDKLSAELRQERLLRQELEESQVRLQQLVSQAFNVGEGYGPGASA